MDIAITESTETVASNLAKKTDMSKSCAKKQVSNQVERIAEEGYLSEYTMWENRQKKTDIMNSAKGIVSKLTGKIDIWTNNLNSKIQRWRSTILWCPRSISIQRNLRYLFSKYVTPATRTSKPPSTNTQTGTVTSLSSTFPPLIAEALATGTWKAVPHRIQGCWKLD